MSFDLSKQLSYNIYYTISVADSIIIAGLLTGKLFF